MPIALTNAKRRNMPYKVILLDAKMPEMDGIEATKAIISEYPDAKVIMVTSHGQEKMVLDALKAGAKGYVLKPFQQQKVYEVIQKACNRNIELHFFCSTMIFTLKLYSNFNNSKL